jgi:hypothetical protein
MQTAIRSSVYFGWETVFQASSLNFTDLCFPIHDSLFIFGSW